VKKHRLAALIAVTASVVLGLAPTLGLAQETEAVDPGQTTVAPAAEWVRVASNNIGYGIVGYRVANQSVGSEWMLLDVGLTVPQGSKNQVVKRDAFSVSLPDGTVIPMATQPDYQADRGKLRALDARALAAADNINYFPPSTTYPCRIGFFTDASQEGRGPAYDQVELSWERACIGRLYFKIPDGIQYGQHSLNITLDGGMLQVPFKIMTNAEMKELKKQVKEMEKAAKQQKKQQK
jgi:hypothetical protein